MADVKISALPASAGLVTTDIFPVVDDPAGTPVTQKATIQQILDLVPAPSTPTKYQMLQPTEYIPPASTYARISNVAGASHPVTYLAFAVTEVAYFQVRATDYTTGDISVTIYWNSSAQTSGNVEFEAALLAYTPNTDSANYESDSFATGVNGTDAHLGTTAQRIMSFTIVVNQLDGLAQGDLLTLRLTRIATSGEMTGDCRVVAVGLSYT